MTSGSRSAAVVPANVPAGPTEVGPKSDRSTGIQKTSRQRSTAHNIRRAGCASPPSADAGSCRQWKLPRTGAGRRFASCRAAIAHPRATTLLRLYPLQPRTTSAILFRLRWRPAVGSLWSRQVVFHRETMLRFLRSCRRADVVNLPSRARSIADRWEVRPDHLRQEAASHQATGRVEQPGEKAWELIAARHQRSASRRHLETETPPNRDRASYHLSQEGTWADHHGSTA